MRTKAKRAKTQRLLKTDGRPLPKFNKILLDKPDYQRRLLEALNYAQYVFEDSERAKFAREYITTHLKMNASKVPDYEFGHLGSICWLIDNGAQIKNRPEHEDKLVKLVNKYSSEIKIIKKDSVAFRTGMVIGEIEGVLDDVSTRKNDITQPFDIMQGISGSFNVDEVYRWFRRQLIDIRKGGEGYDEIPEQEMNMMCSALQIILDDCKKFKVIKTKKPVKKKK